MDKPFIGILPHLNTEKMDYLVRSGYLDAVMETGGIPIMFPPTLDGDTVRQLTHICSGFIFAGGQDVAPALYGEAPLPECGETLPDRDKAEGMVLEIALHENKPILGICRGEQFINVYLGGTLYQDIPSQIGSELTHNQPSAEGEPIHEVVIEHDSPLFSLLERERLPVNSYHHQAIKSLAPDLKVMARATDGLIESFYMPEKRFLWAVQWHPELTFYSDENGQKLFAAFMQAVQEYAKLK